MSTDSQDTSTDSDDSLGVGDSQPPENIAAATEIQDMTVESDETSGSEDSQPPENIAAAPEIPNFRLNINPDNEHLSDTYDDPKLEFSSIVLSSLEKHLPANLLTLKRDEKAKLLSKILCKYISRDELSHKKRPKKYREKIISDYESLKMFPCVATLERGFYDTHPSFYLRSDFREAIKEPTEESYRRIMTEPYPGVFVFQMFRSDVLDRLIEEVDHLKDWAKESKVQLMKPNDISSHGVVLADIGMDTMLQQLVEGFIFPICKVLFNDVCLGKFNSHHGFVVYYGMDAGYGESDSHVDNSEVTVDVCLGDHFEGGETYFRGIRFVNHVNTDTLQEEIFECPNIAGQVMLYRGRHCNGSRATICGFHANMILWCRSSFYREQQNHDKGYFNWCGHCVKELKDYQSQILDAKRKEIIRIEIPSHRSMKQNTTHSLIKSVKPSSICFAV